MTSSSAQRGYIVMTALALVLTCIASLAQGAVHISPTRLFSLLFGTLNDTLSQRDSLILLQIRLPRLLLGLAIGAGLACAGTLMQALFKNPLADPGLIGLSAGGALGAIAAIVLGSGFYAQSVFLNLWLTPLAAFLGATCSAALIFALAVKNGRIDATTLLLCGIAMNALAGACIGLLSYIATDEQLRNLTFWSLGSLAGASWHTALSMSAVTVLISTLAYRWRYALDALLLGDQNARHLGIAVERLKRYIVLATAAGAGVAVAFSGMIGFIGLVAPHLARLLLGPRHGGLLPLACLLGALLLSLADLLARRVIVPTELPIGVLTALLGAPFFLYLLKKPYSARHHLAVDGAVKQQQSRPYWVPTPQRVSPSQILSMNKVGLCLSDQSILQSIQSQVHRGQRVALIGANGSGKSSLLRCLAQEYAYSGVIRLHNRDVRHYSPLELARTMAYMPQSTYLPFAFTVQEFIELGRLPHQEDSPLHRKACVDYVVYLLQLDELRQCSYLSLSGGQQQRVQFARALVQLVDRPADSLLLLDEPTAALDLAQQKLVLDVLHTMSEQGLAMIAVMHDLNLAQRYADTFWLMHNKQLYAQGGAKQIMQPEILEQTFGVRVERIYDAKSQRSQLILA